MQFDTLIKEQLINWIQCGIFITIYDIMILFALTQDIWKFLNLSLTILFP